MFEAQPHHRRLLSATIIRASENSCGRNVTGMSSPVPVIDLRSGLAGANSQVRRGGAGGARTHDRRISIYIPSALIAVFRNLP
ncbi:hypothetical protein FRAHR75_130013 [Frankia sp. Hr75.2]|nr:hypothetical protein FRAHR75_130013 [Frankia sp. Hr75.2]